METVSPNQGSLEGENPRPALKLEIEGMHCAGCVSSVEKALNGLVGVETAEVNLPLKHGKVLYDPERIEPGLIENAVRQAGFNPRRMLEQESIEQSLDSDQKALMETEKRFRIALIFSLPLLVLAMGPMLGLTLPENFLAGFSARSGSWLQFFLTLPVMFAGRDFYLRGLPSLWRRNPNMDTLVALGTLAAFGYSLWNLLKDGGISGL